MNMNFIYIIEYDIGFHPHNPDRGLYQVCDHVEITNYFGGKLVDLR
jgi:hypothetical protein